MTPGGGDTIIVSAKLQKSRYVDEIPKNLNPPKT